MLKFSKNSMGNELFTKILILEKFCYKEMKIYVFNRSKIYVCLYFKFSITTRPILFSFTMELLIGPGKVYIKFAWRVPLPSQEMKTKKLNTKHLKKKNSWMKKFTTNKGTCLVAKIIHQCLLPAKGSPLSSPCACF